MMNVLIVLLSFCIFQSTAEKITVEQSDELLIQKYFPKQDNYTECVLDSCSIQLTQCLLDNKCRPAALCEVRCDMMDPACSLNCVVAYGQYSDIYGVFLNCVIDNKCMPTYPEETCYVGDSDGLANMTSVDLIQGGWWVVRGLNPIYDNMPCQHNRFVTAPPNSQSNWINNVTWKDPYKRDKYVITDPYVTVPTPGLFLHNYTDINLEMIERWVVVSKPDENWMFMLWCGENPILKYAGGIVCAKEPIRTMDEIPTWINDTFRATALAHGVDYDNKMKPNDNTECRI